jgi:succinate-acetate transporter protein
MKETTVAKVDVASLASMELQRAGVMAETVIRDTTANPAPLGLMGFGLTTVLLNLHNAGFIKLGSMILAMGLCYGGVAQIIAGMMEWRKKNTFGTVAFISYGFFWLSLVGLIVMPRFGLADASDHTAMAAYLFVWGLFTLVLLIATLRMSRALVVVFSSLTILFALLGFADATGNEALTRLAGFEGLFCGLSAMYVGAAQILNEVYQRKVLPLGE